MESARSCTIGVPNGKMSNIDPFGEKWKTIHGVGCMCVVGQCCSNRVKRFQHFITSLIRIKQYFPPERLLKMRKLGHRFFLNSLLHWQDSMSPWHILAHTLISLAHQRYQTILVVSKQEKIVFSLWSSRIISFPYAYSLCYKHGNRFGYFYYKK